MTTTDLMRRGRAPLVASIPIALAVACGGSSTEDPSRAAAPPPSSSASSGGPTVGPDGRKVGLVLLADTNRSGAIELDAADEEAGREGWDDRHGAIVLPNIDDDEGRRESWLEWAPGLAVGPEPDRFPLVVFPLMDR